jgi:hypothetical protein
MNIKNWKWYAKRIWRKVLRLKRRFVSWVLAAQDLRLVIAIVVAIKIAELI